MRKDLETWMENSGMGLIPWTVSGADLGFVKGGGGGGGLTQGWVEVCMQSMLELGGSGGMPPQENFEK